jgi:hypothetical protein
MSPTAQRLLIHRRELTRTRLVPERHATEPLTDGEVRLSIEHFALTANNITYAAFGEAMKYWQFFPAPEAERAEWACLPVWGFATVAESRHAGVAAGQRVYGYVPAGAALVVQPARVSASGFVDAAPHRQELAAVYNHYQFCAADPSWSAATEGLQAVLKPLFTTAFLIDDFLTDNADFASTQVLLSSASSKTAFATAFCIQQRSGPRPQVIGLTSAGHRASTQALGCYDRVITYDELETLDRGATSVYIDFAGNAALRRHVHVYFDSQLAHSASIGGTHWQDLGGGGGLPGPRPVLFFAPAQIKKRSAPPPEGWGAAVLQQRIGQSWAAFLARVQQPGAAWLSIVTRSGGAAIEQAYQDQLAGKAPASEGWMLQP